MHERALLGGCFVIAAAAAAQENVALETIVVTAHRTPTALNSTASSVSTISRDEIEARQLVSLADVLRDIPGVSVSRTGNAGAQTQLRMRGSEANHVLVMIDGVEVNDPAVGDEFQFEHLTASNIERVEVVRGPQSALWGSDAVGGVVNVITRPALAASASDGSFEAGSFGAMRLAGQLQSRGDEYWTNLSLAHLDADGTNISRTGDERDGYRNTTASLSAGRNVSDTTSLEFLARHTTSEKELDAIDFVQTGLPTDADRLSENSQSYLKLAASFRPAGPAAHALKLTFLDTGGDNFADGDWVSSTAAEKVGVYYQLDFEFESEFIDSLTFAADHERMDFRQRGIATEFGDPNHDQSLTTAGYVLEYRVSPAEPLHLSASLRHDRSSAFASVTTYRLTGAYTLPDQRTRLRVSLGSGQKAPTFIERFGFFPGTFLGNPDLEPETSDGWEIGVDRSLLNAQLDLSATYFEEELSTEINGFAFDPQALAFTAINEAGTSNRRGVELSASATPTERLRLTASYTRLTSTEPGDGGQQVDELRRPNRMASLNLNYAPTTRLNLNLNVSYNGAQDDRYFPPFPSPAERLRLPSYTLLTVAGSLALTDTIELTGRVENLMDEDYEDVVGFTTPGTAAYVGVRVRR